MQKSGGAAIPMQLDSEKLEFQVGDIKILEKMTDLPTDTPFEKNRIDFLNDISQELLADKEARTYSDVVTYAFWLRRANMEREKKEFFSDSRLRMGRGVIFHVAPSNVAVNYAYSFAVGFILGNANIVRLPSREFAQVSIINRVFLKTLNKEKYAKWKDYMVFLQYARDKAVNDYFSSICDIRIIWGGDATIHEIRKSELQPRAEEITFADRYSICIIDAEKYMDAKDKDRLALDFYNDTYLTDQNACTSPRLVCWLGDSDMVRQAKEIFWEKLWNVVAERYTFQLVQFIDKLTDFCLAAASIDLIHVVKMKDNRIIRIEMEKINPLVQKYRGNSGVFFEYEPKSILDLVPICSSKLQTVAILGDAKMLLPLIESGVKGIDRVVKIGNTMDFGFVWDGYDLRERLTRRIDGYESY